MTGFAVNHKLSFPTALRSLEITGLNVSRIREIILKGNVVLMSVTQMLQLRKTMNVRNTGKQQKKVKIIHCPLTITKKINKRSLLICIHRF